jgi:hypothetical protein
MEVLSARGLPKINMLLKADFYQQSLGRIAQHYGLDLLT